MKKISLINMLVSYIPKFFFFFPDIFSYILSDIIWLNEFRSFGMSNYYRVYDERVFSYELLIEKNLYFTFGFLSLFDALKQIFDIDYVMKASNTSVPCTKFEMPGRTTIHFLHDTYTSSPLSLVECYIRTRLILCRRTINMVFDFFRYKVWTKRR